jgi:cystathionine beta-lyase
MSVAHIEATYLAWIDCTDLNIGDASHAQQFFYEQAGIAFSKGSDYGDNNYIRMNFGCPTATMIEAFKRIRKAVDA